MPMLAFKCECGHEFEKIVAAKQALYKWCKHCDSLTTWSTINEAHHIHYKEEVCSRCNGNSHILPTTKNKKVHEKILREDCPKCGGHADHVVRIERRGSHTGGPTVSDSSVRFNFNYLSPEDS